MKLRANSSSAFGYNCYEWLARCFIKLGRDAGYDAVTIDTPYLRFTVGTSDRDFQAVNADTFQQQQFESTPTVDITVTFGAGAEKKEYKCLVSHSGFTDAPRSRPASESSNAVDAIGQKLSVYEIANTPDFLIEVGSSDASDIGHDMWPVYGYFIAPAAAPGYDFLVLGKACTEAFSEMAATRLIGRVKCGAGYISLFSSAFQVDVSQPKTDIVPSVEDIYQRYDVLLQDTSTGELRPFWLSNSPSFIDGAPLRVDVAMQIVKMALAIRLNPNKESEQFISNDHVVIPVTRDRNYRLSEQAQIFYDRNVYQDAKVMELCKNLVVSQDGIDLRMKNVVVPFLFNTSVTSSFVLSLISLSALKEKGSFDLVSAMYSLNSAIGANALKVVSGEVYGNTSDKKELFALSSGVKLVRVDSYNDGDYILLGVDVTPQKDQLSHWVVAQMVDGKPICMYDPYSAVGFAVGSDLSPYLAYPDTEVRSYGLAS